MDKNQKKKLLFKSAAVSTAVLAPAVGGLTAALLTYHVDETKPAKTAYENLVQGELLFKLYSPYFSVDKRNNQEVVSIIKEAKDTWQNSKISLTEKLVTLDRAQSAILTYYVQNLDQANFKNEDNNQYFWKKVISNQVERIRDKDIQEDLTEIPTTNIEEFLHNLANDEVKNQQNFLHTLGTKIEKLVNRQNELFRPYIENAEKKQTELIEKNIKGLTENALEQAQTTLNKAIETKMRENDLNIQNNKLNELYDRFVQKWDDSSISIHEMLQYHQKISDLLNNPSTADIQNEQIQIFLKQFEKAKEEIKTENDIELLKNYTVTTFQQLTDNNRSIIDIKQVISDLKAYVNQFPKEFNKYKQELISNINSAIQINSKNDLIEAKKQLFSKYYAIKFASERFIDSTQNIEDAFDKKLIDKVEKTIFKNNLEEILHNASDIKDLVNNVSKQNEAINSKIVSLITYNNELELLRKQVKLVNSFNFTSKDTKVKLNSLVVLAEQTYTAKNLSPAYLSGIRYQLNEEMRVLLKGALSSLIIKAQVFIDKLEELLTDSNNNNTINRLKELNETSSPKIKKFNPVPTTDLIETIKLYNDYILNSIQAYEQSEAEKQASFAKEILATIFKNPYDNDENKLTKGQQDRMDLYNGLNETLVKLRDSINAGTAQENTQNEIANLSKQLNNLIKTAPDFAKLDNQIADGTELNDRVKNGPFKNELQQYTDALDFAMNEANILYSKPNVTTEEIQNAKNRVKEAADTLRKQSAHALLDDKLNRLKNEIETTYKSNPDLPGSQNLRSQYNKLKNQVENDILDEDSINILANKIDNFTSVVAPVYSLEVEIHNLEQVIKNHTDKEYTGDNTDNAIKNAQDEIVNAKKLVDDLNNPDNIPNQYAYESEKLILVGNSESVKLAYKKDRVIYINKKIQKTSQESQEDVGPKANYNSDLQRLNQYVAVKQSDVNIKNIIQLGNLLEKQEIQARTSSEVFGLFDRFNNEQDKSIATYLSTLLANNNINYNDNIEEVEEKTKKLKTAVAVAEAKKEYLDTLNSLKSVLENQENYKMYKELSSDITKVEELSTPNLYNDDLTVDEIFNLKENLSDKIINFEKRKADILSQMQDALNANAQEIKSLELEIENIKRINPDYVFNHYFEKTKEIYLKDKEENNWSNFGIDDARSYKGTSNNLGKLRLSFKKDLVFNHLEELKSTIDSVEFGSSTYHDKIKRWTQTFIGSIKTKLQNPDLNEENIFYLDELVSQENSLLRLQMDSAKALKRWERDDDSKTLYANNIYNLSNSLEINQPVADNDYNNLVQLKNDLYNVYEEEVSLQELRDTIVDRIQNDIKKKFNNLINAKNKVSEKLAQSLESKYLSWLDKTKNATSKNELREINQEIDILSANSYNIVELGYYDAKSNDLLNQLSADVSEATKKYSGALRILVNTNSSSYLTMSSTNLSSSLIKTKRLYQLLEISHEISNNVNSLKEYVDSTSLQFYTYQAVAGSSKKNQLKEFLDLFLTASDLDENSNDSVSKLNKLKDQLRLVGEVDNLKVTTGLIEEETKISDAIKALKEEVRNDNDVDVTSLIKILWDSVPTGNENDDSSLGKQESNTYKVNDLVVLSADNWTNTINSLIDEMAQKYQEITKFFNYRKETRLKINLITEKLAINNDTSHKDFKRGLKKLLEDLNQKNNRAKTLTENPDESGELNKIRKQVSVVIDKYESLENLGLKVYDLEQLLEQIHSKDDAVVKATEDARLLVEKSKSYFEDISKISLSNGETVEKMLNDITNTFNRLRLIFFREQVKSNIDNDNTLDDSEKLPIRSLLSDFDTEFSNEENETSELYAKYFRSYLGLEQNFEANRTLIQFVLDKSIELKMMIANAQNYVIQESSAIDNDNVKNKFNFLKEVLSVAKIALKEQPNSEANKSNSIKQLKTAIDNVFSAKKQQIASKLNYAKELKTYIETNNNIFSLNQSDSNVLIPEFQTNAIDKLQTLNNDLENISYGQANSALSLAQEAIALQINKLYINVFDKAKDADLSISDYITDFDPKQIDARSGSNVTEEQYNKILKIKNSISSIINANYNDRINYQTVLSPAIEAFRVSVDEKIKEFTDFIKNQFDLKMSEKENQEGFYVKVVKELKKFSQNEQNTTSNYYETQGISLLEPIYNKFEQDYEALKNKYKQLDNNQNSGALSQFSIQLNKLNNQFELYKSTAKKTIKDIVNTNQLKDIFEDLYVNVKYETENELTSEIKNQYNAFIEEYQREINSIPDQTKLNGNIDAKTWTGDSNAIFGGLKTIIEKIQQYNGWLKENSRQLLLFKQIDHNPNVENPLPKGNKTAKNAFEKKYQVIIANDTLTKEKFENKFNDIITQSNLVHNNKLDITKNDQFLSMFKQFAFTNKDLPIQGQGGEASMFSPIKFNVYIKKINENGWFEQVNETDEDLDRKTLKAKIIYSYNSNNEKLPPIEIEREVFITFKTIDKVQLRSGSSEIFFNGDKVGFEAKVKVFDTKEAGWNFNYEDREIQLKVAKKAYNNFKSAIFLLEEGKNATLNRYGIISPNQEYIDSPPEHVFYDGTRWSAEITKETKLPDAAINILNQEALAFTYNVFLSVQKKLERFRILFNDSTQEIWILQIDPGLTTGNPTIGTGSWDVLQSPQWYERQMYVNSGNPQYHIYSNQNFANAEPSKNLVNLNLYKFNFYFDNSETNGQKKSDLYIYNSWMDNVLLMSDTSNSLKREIDRLLAHKRVLTNKEKMRNQLTTLKSNLDTPNYVITPDELGTYISAISALHNGIFGPMDGFGNLLLSGAKNALAPVWPINGGQSIIRRKTLNDPTTTFKGTVASSTFNINEKESGTTGYTPNKIAKASAFNVLYASAIDEFWFKIRKEVNNDTNK